MAKPKQVERQSLMMLTKEEKQLLMTRIQTFFQQERDENIGLIAAEEVLDFFIEQLGPVIYNKSLEETKRWFAAKMEDLEGDYHFLYK